MRKLPFRLACLAAVGLALGACESTGDNVLSLDATGAVFGMFYIDRDGSNQPTQGVDLPLANARVLLLRPGATTHIAESRTDAGGVVRFTQIPVGRYRLQVDPGALGDSIRLSRANSDTVTVTAGDTTTAVIAFGYRVATVAEARALPNGRVVTLEGIALNALATFGDGVVHVADRTGAIRVVHTRTVNVSAGDSVRVTGTVTIRDGQPTIADPLTTVLGLAQLPAPRAVTTAVAANAQQGALDAAQVRVRGATVINVQTMASGDSRITVNDGSGPLDVVVDRDARVVPNIQVLPGAVVDVTGVLTPSTEGAPRWWLKPRVNSDLVAEYPTITIAQARGQQVGMVVAIEGVALNGFATFGDQTVHVSDRSGAIRLVQLQAGSFVFAGDSLRAIGVLAIATNGQPTLVAPMVTVLGRTAAPQPTPVSTARAANAANGSLDAQLVRVTGPITVAEVVQGGGYRIVVNDGSGPVEVFIGPTTGIPTLALVVGARVTVTGLLVAAANGQSWVVRPRTRDDVSQ